MKTEALMRLANKVNGGQSIRYLTSLRILLKTNKDEYTEVQDRRDFEYK